jgi:hypothetical protein
MRCCGHCGGKLRLPDLCVRMVRKLSTAFDERSSQLFAPVVQFSPFGDVVKIEGIGGRLAREIHAMQAGNQASKRPCDSALATFAALNPATVT